MKTRRYLIVFLPIALIVVAAGHRVIAEKPTATEPADPDANAESDFESRINNLVTYAMPNPHHRLLGRMIGEWNMVIRYRMDPDSPVAESEGTCQRKWIMDNRFVYEEFDGGDLGLPFRGAVIYGYDAFEGKYTSAWVNTMSTAIMTHFGTYDKATDSVKSEGLYGDPWSGRKLESRGVTRFEDKDNHALELYVVDGKGREFLTLEIAYTRAAAKEQPGEKPE